MYNADLWVCGRIAVDDLTAAVRRTVVNEQQFVARPHAVQRGVQAFTKAGGRVIDRNDDGKAHSFVPLSPVPLR